MASFRFSLAAVLAAVTTLGFATPVLAQAQPAKPKAAAPKQPAKPTHSAAVTPAGGAQPALLGQFGDWGAYAASPGGHKVCFALAKPSSSRTDPPNRPRDPAYLFVSTRPAEKVKEEVSVIIGYGFKPSSDATVEVGGNSYAMYTQNDGAWIKNAAEEARLVEAMRKGSELVVKGMSARGTLTTDNYSLRGLTQALDRVSQECR
ncbi:MAG TPA: invasion associated locus B family protein [Xanthobacteraceae bacterium]|jgi:hypothetical protein|nr:invasion associated locus B family protein [Xanthobacteraceae bacterium]